MSEELQGRIDALQAMINDLQHEVEKLKDSEQRARQPSMRTEVRCPSCNSRRLLHAEEVLDRDQGRQQFALAQPSMWFGKGVGHFEAVVCTQCGLCEWWVKDLDELLVQVDAGKLPAFRILSADHQPKDPNPYR